MISLRRFARLLIISGAIALLWLPAAEAWAAGVPSVKLSFHRLGAATGLAYNSRRVYAGNVPTAAGVLFDDRTSTRVMVNQHGCILSTGHIIEGTIAFSCASAPSEPVAPAAYSFPTASWTNIAISPQAGVPCGGGFCTSNNFLQVAAAGPKWLQLLQSNCSDDTHCATANVFQNLSTGAVLGDPTVVGGHSTLDLAASALTKPLCSPITVPSGGDQYSGPAPTPGFVTQVGRYVISHGVNHGGPSATYLRQCGTLHRQRLLNGAGAALSDTAAVWPGPHPETLFVDLLPSQRMVSVRLPSDLQQPGGFSTTLAVTNKRVYFLDQRDGLWAARLPTDR